MDISETGAMVQMPESIAADEPIALSVEAPGVLLCLAGRVVRSSPHPVDVASDTMAGTEYNVAIDFGDLPEDQAAALRRFVAGE